MGIIEKVLANQLIKHLEKNNIWRTINLHIAEDTVTKTALLHVESDIDMMLAEDCVFSLTSVSVTFNTIGYLILLYRLESLGIHASTLLHSDSTPLEVGVHQGSILGPVLALHCVHTTT